MIDDYPKITIVTPSFNQGQFIEQTILSVLEQNYSNLEYIIIDGGSTDKTLEIIKKYEQHLTLWVSEPDKGQSHAINKGLAVATGDVFNWINSDDYLEPGSLHEIGLQFDQHPDLKLLCGYGHIFDDNKKQSSYLHRTKIYKTVGETVVKEQINQQGMFYKLNCIKEMGGVNESLNYVMDLELWFRFMLKFGVDNIGFSDKILGNFRYHDDSKTTNFEEIFRAEAKQVFQHIFKKAELPEAIISAFETSKTNYKPQNWDFQYLEKKELLMAVSERYLFEFYKQSENQAAKIAYIQQLRNKQVGLNSAYLSLFYRLFISHKEYGK